MDNSAYQSNMSGPRRIPNNRKSHHGHTLQEGLIREDSGGSGSIQSSSGRATPIPADDESGTFT